MNDKHRIKSFCLKEACSGKEEKKKTFPATIAQNPIEDRTPEQAVRS
jgi:hypothetical protein